MFAGINTLIVIFFNNKTNFRLFLGLITVIIKGSVLVGGLDVVWSRAVEGERIEFFE